jgi:hypothetical protein
MKNTKPKSSGSAHVLPLASRLQSHPKPGLF